MSSRFRLFVFTAPDADFPEPAARIRLEILCRQWEIAELLRDMGRAETTVKAIRLCRK